MRKVLTETMSVTPILRRIHELLTLTWEEDGQAMVEYAMLLSLIAIVAFGAVNFFGLGVSHLYSKVVSVYP
jgi:Flp pilus assembly pilin Flp